MTCHLCGGRIVIATDPANAEYVVVEGALRRNEVPSDPAADGMLVVGKDKEEEGRLETSAFSRVCRVLCLRACPSCTIVLIHNHNKHGIIPARERGKRPGKDANRTHAHSRTARAK
jgi:hypothetical protein